MPKPSVMLAVSPGRPGLLSICSSCRRIRDTKGRWVPLETYELDTDRLQLSHGICDRCAERLYPQYFSHSR